jgi:hypothetical protein
MASITATVSFLISVVTGCLANAATIPTNSNDASAARRPPSVEFRKQVFVEGDSRSYRELPVVTAPDDANAERFINQDLEKTLGGAGFSAISVLPEQDTLQMGDSLTRCATGFIGVDVLSIVCRGVSMGAHPYEYHHSFAYDLRPGNLKRLAARDLFTDDGAAKLANLVADRVRAQLAERGVTEVDVAPTIDPFELYADHLEVSFDRCTLGTCMNGSATVRLSCAELTPHLRSDSPWRCQ